MKIYCMVTTSSGDDKHLLRFENRAELIRFIEDENCQKGCGFEDGVNPREMNISQLSDLLWNYSCRRVYNYELKRLKKEFPWVFKYID